MNGNPKESETNPRVNPVDDSIDTTSCCCCLYYLFCCCIFFYEI